MRLGVLGTAVATTTTVVILFAHGSLGHSLPVHVTLEATASLVNILVGFLVFGRLQRNSRLNEMTLVAALAVGTLSNVLFVLVPMLMSAPATNAQVWAAIISRTVACALFTLAAFIPGARLRRPRLAQVLSALGVLSFVSLTAVVTRLFGSRLPRAVTSAHGLHADPAVYALELAAAVLAGAAAVGYLRRSEQLRDEFSGWLAIAAIFAAASNLSYATDPTNYSTQYSVGDVFRFCFYAVLLIGSMREIRSYWHALASAIVAEERQRIARDLHDGLSQELAYLTRNLSSLQDSVDETTVRQLRSSVQRARIAARQAIHRVASAAPPPIEDALSEAAKQVAGRFGLDLELDLASGIGVAPPRADALVGIASEALTNAAQHSGSRRVSLILRRDGGRVRMRVRDAGHGFDVAARRGGFGLISMHDRARSVGGEMSISSEPGAGSQVDVML